MAFVQTILSSPFGALAGLLATMVIGELISKLTKGIIPQALATTLLLMAGFWTKIFPANIVECAGISANLFSIVAAILVANLGTIISGKQMVSQWKTVVIAIVAGIAAIIVICMTAGAAIFGMPNAAAACPPLTGGAIASAMVRERAAAVGNTEALTVAIVCMSLQSIVGYPLVSLSLKNEAKRLVKLYRAGELKAVSADEKKIYKADSKKESTNLALFKLAIIAILSMLLGQISIGGFSISMYVWALLLGFIGHEIGLLQTDCLTRSGSNGLCITILMLYLFGGLSATTPEMLFSAFGVGITLIIMCTIAMAGLSFVMSKVLKKGFWLCFAIALNCYLGFPINVILTNEALALNTEEGEERDVVNGELMPAMLVAGFVCVTIVSVVVAGIMLPYIV